jgi:ABC-type lipoprotein export system ATPase subunit
MEDDAQRRKFLRDNSAAALVSPEMPLRANLAVLENIGLIPQFRQNLGYLEAADVAWNLLLAAGHTDIAYKRDPDLSHAERFVAKLLRVVIGTPPIILIDRPGMLLPDVHYPSFVDALLGRLASHLNDCWIVDYRWNEPLYAPR